MNYNENFSLEPIKYFCEFEKKWKVEQWKDVLNYEGVYQVSDLGRIKSVSRIKMNKGFIPILKKEMIMTQSFETKKYLQIVLCKNSIKKTIKVHQLVAIAFLGHIPCGHKLVINHKNFIKYDNRLNNLEIVTTRENSNLKHLPSSSKFVGVHYSKKLNKYRARIVINKKRIHLGYYFDEYEAHLAYKNALSNIK